MDGLTNKIGKEIVAAMKEKNKFRLMALKMIKTELLNNQKEKKPRKDIEVVASYYKKLAKNLDIYKEEVALDNLKKELVIIKEFMPKELSREELESLIEKHLELGNFGQIMKAVKEEVAGVFDGKLVSEIIKGKLNE